MPDLDLSLKPAQSGARLRHNTRRNELCRIEDRTRPLDGPHLPCGLCRRRVLKTIYHRHKTYHIYVRDDGTIENESVSAEVFTHLNRLGYIGPQAHQFTVVNEITAPPPIAISPAAAVFTLRAANPGAVNADRR